MIKLHLRKSRPTGNRGFSLIEVMIASGLLGFEILAVIAMFGTSAKTNSFSKRLTTASNLALSGIEEAKNTPYANLSTLTVSPKSPLCFDNNMNEDSTCSDASYIYTRQTTIYVNTPSSEMTEVHVQVTWTDDSGNTHGTTMISAVSRY